MSAGAGRGTVSLGTLRVEVEEVRKCKLDSIRLETPRETHETQGSAVKTSDGLRWSDQLFELDMQLESDWVEVSAVKKKLIGQPAVVARVRLGLAALEKNIADAEKKAKSKKKKDVIEDSRWYSLAGIVGRKKAVKAGGAPTAGEVRLRISFVRNEVKEERKLTGEIVDSQWTAETSGGTLLNHTGWASNPQFLLTVADEKVPVKIDLMHPPDSSSNELLSFSVVRYDEVFWRGARISSFERSQVVKMGDFFHALFASQATQTLTLREGKYVIIPVNEEPGYKGGFTVNVNAVERSQRDVLDLFPLGNTPGTVQTKGKTDKDRAKAAKKAAAAKKKKKGKDSDSDSGSDEDAAAAAGGDEGGKKFDFKSVWTTKTGVGRWTLETSGGGDFTGASTSWRKNPQYLLTVEAADDDDAVKQVAADVKAAAKKLELDADMASSDSGSSSSSSPDSDSDSDSDSDHSDDEEKGGGLKGVKALAAAAAKVAAGVEPGMVPVSLVLAQSEKDFNIGFYVLRYDGNGLRKTLSFKPEDVVASTDAFRMVPTAGKTLYLHPGRYAVVCCTAQPLSRAALSAMPSDGDGFRSAGDAVDSDDDSSASSSSDDDKKSAAAKKKKKGSAGGEPGVPFVLRAAADTRLASLELDELSGGWEHEAAARSKWKGPTAGGAPNNDTFTDNPQYALRFAFKGKAQPARVQLELVVGAGTTSVGFLALRPPGSEEEDSSSSSSSSSSSDGEEAAAPGLPELSRFEHSYEIKQDLVHAKPEGWAPVPVMTLELTVTAKQAAAGLIVIPSTFNPGDTLHFVLNARSDQPVRLDRLPGGPGDDSDDSDDSGDSGDDAEPSASSSSSSDDEDAKAAEAAAAAAAAKKKKSSSSSSSKKPSSSSSSKKKSSGGSKSSGRSSSSKKSRKRD